MHSKRKQHTINSTQRQPANYMPRQGRTVGRRQAGSPANRDDFMWAVVQGYLADARIQGKAGGL